jgi:3-deoxy-D-manno-octulosonic-acid transferase
LYTLALRAALPFILLRLWWRGGRESGYRESVAERFGKYAPDKSPSQPAAKIVWIHAVSVGEARAAAPLVHALRQALPGYRLLMTCMTAAGRATLAQLYGEVARIVWLPYDYPGAVHGFIEHFKPRLGVLMETEIWPNLLAACAANGVPVLLANARMSEKSARRYARWTRLTAPALRGLAAVCAQSVADADRLRELGAPPAEVTGNLKFDVLPAPSQVAAGRAWREKVARPVLLLASTREGEEKMLLDALSQAGRSSPRSSPAAAPENLLVLIVPRHPQRFDDVAQWTDARRSRAEFPDGRHKIYLGDTMGEMAFYFAAADVAVIGGSFAPLGGQNLIEALAVGTPVVAGPSMFNFAEATRLAVRAGAAIQAADAVSAIGLSLSLLLEADKRARMSAAGRALCEAHRGATERHLRACLRLMGSEQISGNPPTRGSR